MRDLVRFILLTPLRRDEAAGPVWGEVDLDRGWIRIGADRMKNGEAHELPLSDEALSILKKRKPAKAEPHDLAFPSGEGTIYSGWTRLLTRIRKAIGQKSAARDARFSLHDIRRAFVTHQAEMFDESLLDLIIAHKPASRKGSGAAYQKAKRLNERPPVMASWARMVLAKERSTADSCSSTRLQPFDVMRGPAGRAIEVPSSVPLDPPPQPSPRIRRPKPTSLCASLSPGR